ncbi:MAG: DUF624 domain-containing protein [Firmicutes bacterium]|nr:DUF624 domain-containing protein [Bacillota bacterium]
MAGIFGLFDYTKPGKGVPKDAPEKRPFFLFFELLWRKLSQIILLNLIYFIILLPLLTAVYFIVYGFIFSRLQQAGADAVAQTGVNFSEVTVPALPGLLLAAARAIPAVLRYALLAASVVLYGPASCALAFMLRNFVQQQHVWISDFFERLRQNFKQGLALGLLDVFLLVLLIFNITITGGTGFMVLTVVQYMSMALLFLYLLMRHYLFIMAVTFELKLGQLLKNAIILSGAGFLRNILALGMNAILFFVPIFLFPVAELLGMPLLLFSLTGFVTMFICFPVLKKYLLNPQEEIKSC